MSTTFLVALVAIAILFPLAGVWLGVHLARRTPPHVHRLQQRCVSLLRESEGLRNVVLDFVSRATRRDPTTQEYRALVDAMLYAGTPETIRQAHHKKCGTANTWRDVQDQMIQNQSFHEAVQPRTAKEDVP